MGLYRRNSLINKYYHNINYYYQQLVEHYTDFSEYSRITDLYKKKELVATDQIISFQEDHLFNQKNKKQILKKIRFKQPLFKYRIKKNDLNIEIYFYKIKIGEFKVKLEIHFHERKMFYYNYTFTDYSNTQQLQDIIKIIQEKYLDGLPMDIYTQSIVDKDETVLSIENTMELRIHYISTKSSIIQTLSNYRETSTNMEVKTREKNQNDLKNKL